MPEPASPVVGRRPHLLSDEILSLPEFAGRVEAGPTPVYAILDATDEPRVPHKVAALGPQATPLWRGDAGGNYWAIAPYLARVDRPLLDWLHTELWPDPWGVFLFADVDLEEVATQLRRLFWIEGPDRRRLYFRYYDPRVLDPFLDVASASELRDFFGPIRSFGIPGPDAVLLRSLVTPSD